MVLSATVYQVNICIESSTTISIEPSQYPFPLSHWQFRPHQHMFKIRIYFLLQCASTYTLPHSYPLIQEHLRVRFAFYENDFVIRII